ncbi:MAG: 30S ribosomal protein S8 [Candidatus Harrisonbacteria bacterium]|nr:30S ribosomal protein S8 [Candidatus Harrisonbacteria bacterium]
MYQDLITKIRNAQQAKKEFIKVPYSGMDFAVAEILAKNNYIENVAKKGRLPKRIIEIKIKYDKDGSGVINGTKFLSVPSRHLYAGYQKLRPVKQGHGLGVISTSKGLRTNTEARKQKVGGELLFEIW